MCTIVIYILVISIHYLIQQFSSQVTATKYIDITIIVPQNIIFVFEISLF